MKSNKSTENNKKNNKNKRVTISEVAQEAGTSRTTTSYILGGTRTNFSKKTIENVREAARKLGYTPNIFARGLRTGRTRLIGLLSNFDRESVQHLFEYQIEVGISMEAQKHDMDIIRIIQPIEETGSLGRVAELIDNGLIECLLLKPQPPESPLIPWLLEQQATFVVIGRTSEETVYSVDSDNIDVGRIQAEHLIDMGHRRLAYIAPPEHLTHGVDRIAGFLQAGKEADITSRDIKVVHAPDSTSGGYQAMKKILMGKKTFTGIAAVDDYMAQGALNAIMQSQLAVPDDISVVGCNNDLLAVSQPNMLTTIDLDFIHLGELAAQKAFALLKGKTPALLTKTTGKIIVHHSSGPPKS